MEDNKSKVNTFSVLVPIALIGVVLMFFYLPYFFYGILDLVLYICINLYTHLRC